MAAVATERVMTALTDIADAMTCVQEENIQVPSLVISIRSTNCYHIMKTDTGRALRFISSTAIESQGAELWFEFENDQAFLEAFDAAQHSDLSRIVSVVWASLRRGSRRLLQLAWDVKGWQGTTHARATPEQAAQATQSDSSTQSAVRDALKRTDVQVMLSICVLSAGLGLFFLVPYAAAGTAGVKTACMALPLAAPPLKSDEGQPEHGLEESTAAASILPDQGDDHDAEVGAGDGS
eukprot:TRINITY_DN121702_c0_g1_i1.p1 TRINITY_DN121702_c0_g1~~TRINITY_DN121702_c0_g1_i1.p1  ORF type:complete len:261 (+),score=22.65 TRINITY_DN121702_c0_g1_i1:73-783(+)